MSEDELGRGKRVSVKTPGYMAFQAECDKTKENSKSYARGKQVRKEDEELTQQEEAIKEAAAAKKAAKKLKKAEGKKKAKEVALPTAFDGEKVDIQEAQNIAEVFADEARCNALIYMIHGRTGRAVDQLRTLDLDELEKEWTIVNAQATSAVPSSSKTTAKVSKAPKAPKATTKKPSNATAALPVQTPAKKMTASKNMPNMVSFLNSPLVPLRQAQEQSARAAQPSPAPTKRSRDASKEPANTAKRLRLETEQNPPKQAPPTGITKPSTSTSSSRASSSAPTVASARSASSVPLKSIGQEDSMDLGETEYIHGVVDKEPAPATESKKPKARPKKADFKDTVEETLIEQTTLLLWERLVPNMLITSDHYRLMMLQCWNEAIKGYGGAMETRPLTKTVEGVIRQSISSCRSNGRRRFIDALVAQFNLIQSPTQPPNIVKARAAALLPIGFHQKPECVGTNAGYYRHPVMSRLFAAYWYTGKQAVGILRPDCLSPVPLEAMAFIASMAEDVLGYIVRDGEVKSEVKAKKGEGKGRKKASEKAKEAKEAKEAGDSSETVVVRHKLEDLKPFMRTHTANLETFQSTKPGNFATYQITLHDASLQWVGKSVPPKETAVPAAGTLTADAFADEVDVPLDDVRPQHSLQAPSTHAKPTAPIRPKPCPRPVPVAPSASIVESRPQLSTVPEESDDDDGSSSGSSSSDGSSSGDGSSSDDDSSHRLKRTLDPKAGRRLKVVSDDDEPRHGIDWANNNATDDTPIGAAEGDFNPVNESSRVAKGNEEEDEDTADEEDAADKENLADKENAAEKEDMLDKEDAAEEDTVEEEDEENKHEQDDRGNQQGDEAARGIHEDGGDDKPAGEGGEEEEEEEGEEGDGQAAGAGHGLPRLIEGKEIAKLGSAASSELSSPSPSPSRSPTPLPPPPPPPRRSTRSGSSAPQPDLGATSLAGGEDRMQATLVHLRSEQERKATLATQRKVKKAAEQRQRDAEWKEYDAAAAKAAATVKAAALSEKRKAAEEAASTKPAKSAKSAKTTKDTKGTKNAKGTKKRGA